MAPSPDLDVTFAGDDLVLRLAALAYLARFSAVSRIHTKSDLRLYFYWCAEQQVTPLAVARTEVERYMRWMQEVRRFNPPPPPTAWPWWRASTAPASSTASSTARPRTSPTLGPSHLRFEALLCAARDSDNPPDFALVAMLGLLGSRISEACRCDIDDLGEEHGHRVLRTVGKGTKIAFALLPPAVGRSIDRAIENRVRGPILLNLRGRRMDRHCATRRLRRLSEHSVVRLPKLHPHMLRHTFVTTMLDAGVDLRDVQIAAPR
ncbi:tyrosine-type recombinase/integrase [Nocardia sp. NPDC052001]|uniref:tyrosine-type recombinase/integrase n=1 Tax=Nocardia sp. NPDC052001 TaxID=3154853 RepID=UPI0034471AE4